MKNNKETKKLSRACEVFTDGNWIESKDQSLKGIRLIQTGNIGFGFFKNREEKARYISEETFKRLKCTEIFQGDCLISRLPDPVGRACIIPNIGEKMITAVDCSILRFKPTEMLPEFFNYYAQSNVYLNDIEQKTTGTTRKRISRKNLGFIRIPHPPLSEQKRIVKILDKTFSEIDTVKKNTERNLLNAKEIFDSYLQGVFESPGDNWKRMTLKQISLEFGRGKSKHRPRNDKKLYGGKYPFIQTGEIRNCDHLIKTYSKTYNEVGLKQSRLWPKGTICITIAANIAETGILNFEACFPDSVIGIVVDPKITQNEFVEYLLQSFKAMIKQKGKGSAQDNINLATFKNELFPFPPLNIQKQIVTKLNTLSGETKTLETNYQNKLSNLDELKKSILNKAFNGEL